MVAKTSSRPAEVRDSMGRGLPFLAFFLLLLSEILPSPLFLLLPLRPLSHRIYLNPIHRTTTPPTKNPANFNTATRFPVCAIRPRRPALPLRVVEREENTSFCIHKIRNPYSQVASKQARREVSAYTIINHVLVPRIIINVDRHAAQRGYFGGKFRKTAIILSEVCSDRESAFDVN